MGIPKYSILKFLNIFFLIPQIYNLLFPRIYLFSLEIFEYYSVYSHFIFWPNIKTPFIYHFGILGKQYQEVQTSADCFRLVQVLFL